MAVGNLRRTDPWKFKLGPRWLTAQIEDVGLTQVDGITLAERMVRLVWEAATTGKVTFPNPDGRPLILVLRPRDLLDTWQFIMDRVEGPPTQNVNLHVVQEAAHDIAKMYGLNAGELMAEAERLALSSGKDDGDG